MVRNNTDSFKTAFTISIDGTNTTTGTVSYTHLDTHKLNKPKKNTTKVEADFLLEKGHIGEIEKAILFTINRLVFATSLQITYYLKKSGYQIESKTVARKLTRLKEKSFVRQIEFVSENSISSYKAYYL